MQPQNAILKPALSLFRLGGGCEADGVQVRGEDHRYRAVGLAKIGTQGQNYQLQ